MMPSAPFCQNSDKILKIMTLHISGVTELLSNGERCSSLYPLLILFSPPLDLSIGIPRGRYSNFYRGQLFCTKCCSNQKKFFLHTNYVVTFATQFKLKLHKKKRSVYALNFFIAMNANHEKGTLRIN